MSSESQTASSNNNQNLDRWVWLVWLIGTPMVLAGGVVVFLFLFLWTLAAYQGYERRLPNYYVLVREHNSSVIRTPRGREDEPTNCARGYAVAANIDAITNVGYTVLGHVAPAEQSLISHLGCPGFFILDTTTGEVFHGLTEEEWIAKAAELGVTDIPEQALP